MRSHPAARLAAALVLAVIVILAGAAVIGFVIDTDPEGDPGRSTETVYAWDGPLPRFVDATADWGLSGWRHTAAEQLSGGAAIGDFNVDGAADLVVGGGNLAVFLGSRDGSMTMMPGRPSGLTGEVTAVSLADVDGDGRPELLVATAAGDDLIVWGGGFDDLSEAETTRLAGGEPSTGLMAADLTDDGVIDVLRLGYGGASPAADVIWVQDAPRRFEPVELPNGERRSLAAEVADVDAVGLVDIWVTRDVGWIDGPDSVYSRRDGRWRDVAGEVGGDQAIDGMGITLADLTGDGGLDAYLSDLGDNELLAGGEVFVPELDAGLARIRPPDAATDVISSSWASGAADVNLDGRIDLVVVNGGFAGRTVANKVPGAEIMLSDPPAFFLGLGTGRYADVWGELGLPWEGASRGLALGDLDGDGDTDVVVVNHGGGLRAYRNDAALPGTVVRAAEPACAAGAVVRVMTGGGTLTRLLAPHSFLGAHAPEVAVGGEVLNVTVTFPGMPPREYGPLGGVLDVPCP